jgi:dethiobiotin synthetase
MKTGYFITGTDTEIGKTLVTCAMLFALAQRGVRAAGMKPVAAGAELREGVWHNDDVDRIAAATSVTLPTDLTTPFLLREACAPHIAASLEQVDIDVARIVRNYREVCASVDAVIVEGVGGFRVPLTATLDTADLAKEMDLPVVLVVGLRLGCINHALLTVESIVSRGLKLAGWVANATSVSMQYGAPNIEAIGSRLNAPLLGYLPRLDKPSAEIAAGHLDFTQLPGWPG